MHNHEHQKAFYKGVSVCGSVWTCPVCASRISEGRRAELIDAVNRKAFTKVMVTFTIQHERTDTLAQLVDALNDSIRRLKQGKWWLNTRQRYNMVAYVTASEYTYGVENGWHPHKHMLLFLDKPENEIDTERLQAHLVAHYKKLLAKHGMYASDAYGVHVVIGDNHAGEYVAKWSLVDEVTKSTVKLAKEGGWTPFQLLELYSNGNKQAGVLFQEYAKVTQGKRQLNWSHGAREVLGLDEEKTDEELAEQEEGTEEGENTVLVWFDAYQWKEILRRDLRLKLLEVADCGEIGKVLDFLDKTGVMDAGRQVLLEPG